MSGRNWYQEGSLIDHFRGGSETKLDASNPITFLNTSIPALVTNMRKGAVKSAVKRGEGQKDAQGDIVGGTDLIYGITNQERAAGQETVRSTKLKSDYADTAALYGYSLKNKDGSYKTEAEVTKYLGEREKVKDLVAGSGYDFTDLKLDPNTATLESAGTAIRQKREAAEAELRRPGEELAQGQLELQEDSLEQQTQLAQDRLALTKWQADQDRKFRQWQAQVTASEKGKDRSQAMDLAMLQFQSNQADRAYRRDADERRDRRDERKERQLMIMQLMKGLQQMGQSFVI